MKLIKNNPGIDSKKFKSKYGKKAEIRQAEYINKLEFLIERDGLQNPPKVKKEGKEYMVVAGHHRTQAMKNLGWKTIKCEVL